MAHPDVTKKALADSLKKLLRQRGIEKITVEEICAESMVSRRSFYRYFVDKFDLLTWTYNYDFCRMVEVRPDKTIWDYYPEILRYIHADPQFFKNAFSYTGQNSFRYFCFEKLYPLILNDFELVAVLGSPFRGAALCVCCLRRLRLVAQPAGDHAVGGIHGTVHEDHPHFRGRHRPVLQDLR